MNDTTTAGIESGGTSGRDDAQSKAEYTRKDDNESGTGADIDSEAIRCGFGDERTRAGERA